MTDYTKSTNFASKDSLPSGDPLKIVKGTEINTEFDNIATAVATKADLSGATLTSPTISGGTITGITDLAIADGGTGASTAANARTNLGLVIGTNVQAWDADLDTWATKTAPSGTVVGTSDTQTLTNKTLTSPTIGGTPTMNASVLSSGTAVASTSGTSIDFTSIPSWVKRITVMFDGVSTNGGSKIQIQLGVGGTPETSGYTTVTGFISAASNNTTRGGTNTTGFALNFGGNDPASTMQGSVVLTLLGSNTWTGIGSVYDVTNVGLETLAGSKSLAGVLNMIRITTVSGTDTFDAGSINILYE